MKEMRKTRISLACAAALASIGASTGALAVNLSQDNIGDLLIFPYYTVRANPVTLNQWQTDFTIINTSDSTVAAKVRFHEGRNSREVLDFNVVLSPHDMLQGWVADPGDGPRVYFPNNSERTCIIPIPTGRSPAKDGTGGYLKFKNLSYLVFEDGFDETDPDGDGVNNPGLVRGDIDRAREGYFTVIEMGSADPGLEKTLEVPKNANHASLDCVKVADAFSPANIVDTYHQFERNLNALKGIYGLTNVVDGVQGVGIPVTMANFATWNSVIAHTVTSVKAGAAAAAAASKAAKDAKDLVKSTGQAFIGAAEDCNAVSANDGTIVYYDDGTFDGSGNPVSPPVPYVGGPVSVTPAPGQCNGTGPENATLSAAYAEAEAAHIQAVNDYPPLQYQADIAQLDMLSPARNLITAQDDNLNGTFPADHFYPNINSGDFTAMMLIDGQYADDGVKYNEKTIMPPPIGCLFPSPNPVCDDPLEGYAHDQALYGGHYLRGVDAVTALLMRREAINEWADNAITGAETDLVYTAPTKSWYTDWDYVYFLEPHASAIQGITTNIFTLYNNGWPPFAEQFDGESCDLVGIVPWNREEITINGQVDSSPSFFNQFCWETNVLHTGQHGSVFGSYLYDFATLGDPLPIDQIAPNPVDRSNGWVSVKMDRENVNIHPALDLFNSTAVVIGHDDDHVVLLEADDDNRFVQVGMPYIGFSYKLRDFSSPSAAFGGLSDHSYIREFKEANFLGGRPDFLPEIPDGPIEVCTPEQQQNEECGNE